MTARRLLAIVAAGEAATGLALVLVPAVVVDLLFGATIAGVGVVVCRIGGFSLIALGVACWPGVRRSPAIAGMLAYTTPVALYLVDLGCAGTFTGTLLWPAAVVHLLVAVLLTRAWLHLRPSRDPLEAEIHGDLHHTPASPR